MTSALPTEFNSFLEKIKTLQPQIGSWGGRYFQDPQQNYYRLNQLVQHFDSLCQEDPQKKHDIRDILTHIKQLDAEGTALLIQKKSGHSLKSYIITIGTCAKQFFGNFRFDRKKTLKSLKAKHIDVVYLNKSEGFSPKAIDEKLKNLPKLEEEKKSLEGSIKKLQEDHTKAVTDLEQQKNSLDQKQQKALTLGNELSALKNQHTQALENTKKQAEQQQLTHTQSIDKLQQELKTTHQTELTKLQKQIDKQKKELETLNTTEITHKEAMRTLQLELKTQKHALLTKEELLTSTLAKLNKRLSSNISQEDLQQETEFKNSLQKLQAEVESQTAHVTELNVEIKALEETQNRLKRVIAGKREELTPLSTQSNTLQEKVNTLNETISEQKQTNTRLSEEKIKLEKTCEDLTNKSTSETGLIQQLEVKKAEITKELTELTKAQEEAKPKLEALKGQIETKKRLLDQRNKEWEGRKTEVDQIIQQKTQELSQLNNDISARKETLKQTIQKEQELQLQKMNFNLEIQHKEQQLVNLKKDIFLENDTLQQTKDHIKNLELQKKSLEQAIQQLNTTIPLPPPSAHNSSNSSNSSQSYTFFGLPDIQNFIQKNKQEHDQALLNSTQSQQDLGPFQTYFSKLDTVLQSPTLDGMVPTLNWQKIIGQKVKTKNVEAFQKALIDFCSKFLKKMGFLVNEQGLVRGIDVSPSTDIKIKKDQIMNSLKTKRPQLTALFLLLSSAGLAGYADQIRTAWAGSVNARARKTSGSLPIKAPQYSNSPVAHEDLWVEAIRKGQEIYKSNWLNGRQKRALVTETNELYDQEPFEKWDLLQLNANPLVCLALREHLKSKPLPISLQELLDLFKKLIFLNSPLIENFQQQLNTNFSKEIAQIQAVKGWAEQIRLSFSSKTEVIDPVRKEMEEKVNDLQKLYDSFGKNKIHPRSIEVAISGRAVDYYIQQLQTSGVLGAGPDQDGFYPLVLPKAQTYRADQNLNVKSTSPNQPEVKIADVLDIAQGKILTPYAARRLAPTFYESKNSNENLDIPTGQMPKLLQYENLYKKVAKNVKAAFMTLIGVSGNNSILTVSDSAKFAFIIDQKTVANLPLGSSVVSIFLDSMASLGDEKGANDLLQFLKQEATITNSQVNTSFWDKSVELKKSFDQATQQIKGLKQIPIDEPVTFAQEMEYRNRRNRLLELHDKGELLVRVIKAPELNDPTTGIYNGSWELRGGPNLSTTLIPRKGSLINMDLFCNGIRGVLLDPRTVSEKYFGKGFLHNAVTQTNNFWATLRNRSDGKGLEWVQENLAQESAEVELGQKPAKRDHTEIAYFRPAERNLVQGLFFKINDEQFTVSLCELITLQKEILDTYGFFLPIFAYKDGLFQEVIVDAQLVKTLGVENNKAAKRILDPSEQKRRQERPQEFFNIYGTLDTQTVIAGKEAMTFLPYNLTTSALQHLTNFKKLFDLQLMILQLKNPQEKISFQMKSGFRIDEFITLHLNNFNGNRALLKQAFKNLVAPTDETIAQAILQIDNQYTFDALLKKIINYNNSIQQARPVDLKLIDNLHLVFPTLVPTQNPNAEGQDLFFSHSALVRFLLGNNDHLQCWIQMAKRNMKVFLGIEITVSPTGGVTKTQIDKVFLNYFKDDTDPMSTINYAKSVARLTQMLTLFGKSDWAEAICVECRQRQALGLDFGTDGPTDFLKNSSEINSLKTYLTNLANQNFAVIAPLPNSSGISGKGIQINLVTNSRMYVAPPPPTNASNSSNSSSSQTPLSTSLDVTEAATFLNKIYKKVWGNGAKSSAFLERRDTAEKRGLTLNEEYKANISYDLVGVNFQKLEAENAFENTVTNAASIQVFYRKEFLQQSEVKPLIVNTAVRTTNGDLDLLLPRGEKQLTSSNQAHFLTDVNRRKKRYALVKVGPITITAKGGYKSTRERLDQKITAYVVSTAGPQFEKYNMKTGELEVADFIVKKDAVENRNPLFKEYYSNGIIPGHQQLKTSWEAIHLNIQIAEARGEPYVKPPTSSSLHILHEDDPHSLKADIVKLRNGDFFLLDALKKSTLLYMQHLVLPAINQTIQKQPAPLYLKATPLGAGFFASLGLSPNFQTSLRKYATEAWVDTYEKLITNKHFNKDTAIEFSFYQLDSAPPNLLTEAAQNNIKIIWQAQRDLLDFSPVITTSGVVVNPDRFTRVIKNAGDVFSFDGNEVRSTSLDSELGNNSDLRLVFNWHFNHHLLDESKYVAL
jgi:hypothetical protein